MENIVWIIFGVIAGSIMTAMMIYKVFSRKMLIESESRYGFGETVDELQKAVEDMGWKIPYVHDLQSMLGAFGYEVKKVRVLEICKPEIAYMMLEGDQERRMSVMLPCRISVYERQDGKVYVSRMNSRQVGLLFGGVIERAMLKAWEESENIIKNAVL
ncbi:DUF302 domain-containing protein [Marinilabiliaceae bacterium JC017]|nr:DUF302 domain-containing protein [Marinilabiliaceae bacterium JC017]